MSRRLTLLAFCALALAAFLPPEALCQIGNCDPNTSYCGGTSTMTGGSATQIPSLTNGAPTNYQNVYGGGGGFNGGGSIGGPSQSIDLQDVPNYTDNLGGRTESTGARSYPLYYQRFFAPDQPTGFQRLVYASVGQMLPIFGARLFLQSPSTFAPVDQVPVTSSYVVGPGDQLLIRVWGQMNFNDEVTVDRAGMVYIPHVGAVRVGGLPYSDLSSALRSAVGRIYKNFELSVTLGQLHPIRIFVTGHARYPGTYTVSSLSTLVSAVFATGGPSPHGSMRHILLRRDGATVADFDMYDLLVRGDKSHDVSLLPGDVIYFPPVGPQVAVYGAVRVPAIYELKGPSQPTTLAEVLADAGGLSPLASLSHASLERIDPQHGSQALDVTLDEKGEQLTMQEGDILRVLPMSPSFEKTVTLRGNVADPGRFAWHPGMRLSELLPDPASLITRDYWQKRNQLGLPSPLFQPDYQQRFTVYRQAQAEEQRQYYLSLQRAQTRRNFNDQQQNGAGTGATGNASALPVVSGDSTNPSDLTGAGGMLPNGSAGSSGSAGQTTPTATSADVASPEVQMPGTVPYDGSPANQSSQNPVSQNPAQSMANVIGGGSLADEQRIARTENIASARYLNDVSLMAPEIDWSYAVIERMDPATLKTELIPFDLGKLVRDHDPSQNLELQPHDVVTIFSQADIRVPQAQQTKLVRIEGEVEHAGIYSVGPNETLRQVVERAGGLTPGAYLFGAELTRESARIVQQQRLDDYVTQLELTNDRATAANAAGAVSALDQAANASTLTATQALITRLRQLRASGRVVLSLPPDAASARQIPDMPLEDGDRFIVPSRPSSVNVVGSVYQQSSFLYEQQRRVYGYLKEAGGANATADNKHAFVIRADGSVLSRESASSFWGNEFEQARVNPGDTIVIPEKSYRGNGLRTLLNFSQLFSSVALGAGALAVITN